MPAKKVNNTSDVIWGNKNVESNARLLPPSRGPVSSDPEWNELVDVLQDPTIGHRHDGSDSRSLSPHDDTQHTYDSDTEPTHIHGEATLTTLSHGDAAHYGTGTSGRTHVHGIGFGYLSARATATYTNSTTTYTNILTMNIPVPINPFMTWAYALCYVDTSTTTAALRLYDTAKGQLLLSPHPDTEYQINHTSQVSDSLMGRDQWNPQPLTGTIALQGKLVS